MAATGTYADWIAVDWGTSNLRAWAMRKDGSVIARAESDNGMGVLRRDGFEPALLALVADWLGRGCQPVVACGMVGSRQGWTEAPYRAVPCAPLDDALVQAPATDPRLSVWIVPGLRQERPADVMRGEETQVAGFLTTHPQFDGVLCLPGTHTKWVQVSAGEVVSFCTFMTGELFDLLSRRSVLRHSLSDDWDEVSFQDAVSVAISRPESLAQRLFAIRAEGLIAGLAGDAARARLSGLLIGAELAASKPYWLGQRVALVGARALVRHYAAALSEQGVEAESADGEAMTLAGLGAAYQSLKETIR